MQTSMCIGLTSFLIIRMWFGKAVSDFNTTIEVQGMQGPKLIAATGNAFTSESPIPVKLSSSIDAFLPVAWVAYAFYVIISLAKLNVTASK
jgi:hypothetical protein